MRVFILCLLVAAFGLPVSAQATPTSVVPLLTQAREHFAASRYRLAQEVLDTLLAQEDSLDARFLRAEVLLERGLLEDALADLDALLAQAPQHTAALALRAYVAATSDESQRQASLVALEQAIALDPTAAYPHYIRALLAMQTADYADAVAAASEALARDADFLLAYNVRASANVAQGRTDDALADYDRITALQPTLAYPYVNRAVIYRMRRDYDKALAQLDQAIAQQADYAPAYVIRAFVHIQLGNASPNRTDYRAAYERALQDLTSYLAVTHPDDVLPDIAQLKSQLEALLATR